MTSGQLLTMMSETLSDQSLQAVPAYCFSAILSRNCHPQPANILPVVPAQNLEITVSGRFRAGKHEAEIFLRA
jgi:hypothetical protein